MAGYSVSSFSGMRPASAPHLLNDNEAQHLSGADLSTGEMRPMSLPVMQDAVWQEVRSLWEHGDIWRYFPDRRKFALSGGSKTPRLISSMESGGLRFQGAGSESAEYTLGLDPPNVAPVRDGEPFSRRSAISFARNGFTVTGQLVMQPGDKVMLEGMLPSGVSGEDTYIIIAEEDGIYRIGSEDEPATALEFTGTGSGSVVVQACGQAHSRSYVFTVVNEFGDESAPSPPSDVFTMDAAMGVALKNLEYTPSEDTCPVSAKRLYRTASGSESVEWLFVDEIPAGETEYSDEKTDDGLGESLSTTDWFPPSAELRHVLELPGGILAAHDGQQVWLSEPFAPYAWPETNRFAVRGPIVALAASQRTVFALTESYVHALTVEDSSQVYTTTMDGTAPCLGPDGVVSSAMGILFPSGDGLYLVGQGSTAPQNVTEGLISEQGWRKLNPCSFLAVWFDTTYLAFYQDTEGKKGSLLLDFGQSGEARMRLMDAWGTALQLVPDNRRVIMAQRSGSSGQWRIYHLFSGPSGQTINWLSRKVITAYPLNMAALHIEGGYSYNEKIREVEAQCWGGPVAEQCCGETPFGSEQSDLFIQNDYRTWGMIKLIADGVIRAVLPIRPGKIQPLPSGYTAQIYELEVAARVPIRKINMATTTAELLGG